MEAIRRHKGAPFTLSGTEEIGEQQKERALLILEWQHIISIIITCLDKITTREDERGDLALDNFQGLREVRTMENGER